MTKELNDSLDDLLGGAEVKPFETRKPVNRAPADFVPAVERAFTENCSKCGGSGRWGYSHRTCFKCNGTGKLTFKTSYESRQKATVARQEKKAANANLYYADNADIAEWIIKNPGFSFAVSLGEAVRKYGSLTDNQAAAARRCITKDAERQVQRKAETLARTVEIGSGLMDAFNTAKARQTEMQKDEAGNRKPPRLTFGAFFVEEARKYPGTLYVKTKGGEYYGKVVDGRFSASRECPQDVRDNVAELVKDPKATAIKYGQRFGVCCVCNLTLTNHKSIEAGIGPICASKMGW